MSSQTHTLSLSTESTQQLNTLAQHRNVPAAELLGEKIEQWLAWEREAMAAHREGLRQIEAGQFLSGEQVREKLDKAILARRVA